MKILSIDTTQQKTYLTLQIDDDVYGFESCGFETHSKTIMNSIENLLSTCNILIKELDAIAVVVGPGSFTGSRLGVSIVKGLAYPHQIKLIAINTLDLLAYSTDESTNGKFACLKGVANEIFCLNCKTLILQLFDKSEFESNLQNDDLVITYNFDNLDFTCKQDKKIYDLNLLASYSTELFRLKQFVEIQELKPLYLRKCQAELNLLRGKNG